MWLKKNDDYRLQYLNDLFDINLIFLRSKSCSNFLDLYGRYALRYETFLSIFSL